ncbi:MAG: BglII/BstYI family type II restriction endonuclease [Planktomarina sp.]
MFQSLQSAGFDVLVSGHGGAILSVDFPQDIATLTQTLLDMRIPASELIGSGGGEAPSTQRLRRALADAGWAKHNFRVETTVDGVPMGDGTSHEIDHIKRSPNGTLALEIEWNNKDPFFDRDLENFQRLHGWSIISAGIIVTRGAALQRDLQMHIEGYLTRHGISREEDLFDLGMKERTARQRKVVSDAMAKGASFASAFTRQFVADKFGMATTHWAKLEDRVRRGVGNPCPLLLIGLPSGVVEPD